MGMDTYFRSIFILFNLSRMHIFPKKVDVFFYLEWIRTIDCVVNSGEFGCSNGWICVDITKLSTIGKQNEKKSIKS